RPWKDARNHKNGVASNQRQLDSHRHLRTNRFRPHTPWRNLTNKVMSTQLDTNSTTTHRRDSLAGHKILGKPVIETVTRILNLDGGFRHKHLCDGPTFSAGQRAPTI